MLFCLDWNVIQNSFVNVIFPDFWYDSNFGLLTKKCKCFANANFLQMLKSMLIFVFVFFPFLAIFSKFCKCYFV